MYSVPNNLKSATGCFLKLWKRYGNSCDCDKAHKYSNFTTSKPISKPTYANVREQGPYSKLSTTFSSFKERLVHFNGTVMIKVSSQLLFYSIFIKPILHSKTRFCNVMVRNDLNSISRHLQKCLYNGLCHKLSTNKCNGNY